MAKSPPKFSEMSKVRSIDKRFGDCEGYVIGSRFKEGRWIYKFSISEDPRSLDPRTTFDNWLPEECLELVK